MHQSIHKDNKMKVCVSLIAILALALLIILWLSSFPQQVPLIQLTPEENNKFISAGVENVVFFNAEAKPVQILDLKANQPPMVREAKKKETFLESVDASVENPDSLKPLLSQDQVKNLLKGQKPIPYIEYRNNKDQQLVVFAIKETGEFSTCKRITQGNDYKASPVALQTVKGSLLDYVIKPAGAACKHRCTPCPKNRHCRPCDGTCCTC